MPPVVAKVVGIPDTRGTRSEHVLRRWSWPSAGLNSGDLVGKVTFRATELALAVARFAVRCIDDPVMGTRGLRHCFASIENHEARGMANYSPYGFSTRKLAFRPIGS
jgi:hypothetical protein